MITIKSCELEMPLGVTQTLVFPFLLSCTSLSMQPSELVWERTVSRRCPLDVERSNVQAASDASSVHSCIACIISSMRLGDSKRKLFVPQSVSIVDHSRHSQQAPIKRRLQSRNIQTTASARSFVVLEGLKNKKGVPKTLTPCQSGLGVNGKAP